MKKERSDNVEKKTHAEEQNTCRQMEEKKLLFPYILHATRLFKDPETHTSELQERKINRLLSCTAKLPLEFVIFFPRINVCDTRIKSSFFIINSHNCSPYENMRTM